MSTEDTSRKLAVTALGLGSLPLAPGTWASAGAVVAYVLLRELAPLNVAVAVLATGTLLALLLGFAVGPWALKHFGNEDPGQFVLDEVVGQWLTCLLLWRAWDGALISGAVAFVAFRFFDIVKPPPIRRVERVSGTWGVMLDDVLAAMYAAVVVWAVVRFVPIN